MKERINTMDSQSPNTDAPIAEPVRVNERIEVLDVIRGFALLGIIIANMAAFSSPSGYLEIMGKNMWTGIVDTIVSSLIIMLVQGKFYIMFSFLFGLGFAIFFERARAKGKRPTLLFYRRLFILLLIGFAHAFLIWHGDILVAYALLGFLLPLFAHRKPLTILLWALLFFFGSVFILTSLMMLLAFAKSVNEGMITEALQPMFADVELRIESSFHAYGHGTFAEIMAQRASDTFYGYEQLCAVAAVIFAIFLLGLYAGKRAIFQNIASNLTLLKILWWCGLVVGLPMSMVKLFCRIQMAGDLFSFYGALHTGATFLGDAGLSLFFITSIVLLYHQGKWLHLFKPLASTGRMALSNYLFQSIVCTTVFYSYGLGLYGKVGPALGLVFAIAIFAVQIVLSKYWLANFQFGPVEWIWRCFTYGKLFKMKSDRP